MTAPVGSEALASVIVAVNPHEHDLAAIMDAWAGQIEAGRYEVLLMHNGSRPGIAALHATHRWRHPESPVRLLPVARRGRAAMNNAGVDAASGEILAFVADDLLPSPGLIAALRAFHEALATPAIGVGAAHFAPPLRRDPFRRWLEVSGRLYGVPFPRCPAAWPQDFFFVGNASMTRATFERVGRFDESFVYDLFEDDDWGRRARALGLQTHYLPRAWAWHDHPVTLAERKIALERLGEASYLYGLRQPGPQPWSELAAAPLERLQAAAERLGALRHVGATIVQRQAWWMAELDCAFVQGYRRAEAERHAAGLGCRSVG